MKTKFKRIGKQSLSVILAVMMMVSTMLVGMVTSNAATVTSDGEAILFFNMKAVDWWNAGTNGDKNFAYFYNSSGGNAWSQHSVKYSENVYYVVIPKGNWDNVILTRNNTTTAPDFNGGNLWNKTGNIALQSDKNYISSFSENVDNAEFSTITPTPTSYSLSADKESVNIGETVTLTPRVTSDLVSLKSNSYSVKKGGSTASTSDYSITENTITFNSEGTYTVSDTITYNAKGYSSIVGSVTTDEVTIIVNATAKEYEFYLTGNMGGSAAGDIGTDKGYKFTKESDGVYTYVITPSGDLYVTITDKPSGKLYAPANYEPLSENTWSAELPVVSGGEKWSIKGQSGKEIKITWDITGDISKGKIKWESNTQIVKPTVTVITGSNQVEFGNTIPLTPEITYNVDKGDVTITDQTVVVNPSTGKCAEASTDSTSGVNTYSFTAPLADGASASDSITYTVTYTVTLSNGEKGTGTKEITANFTNEQSAYKALKTGLGTATYPAPTTYTTDNYPQSLIDDYATAYTAASVVNTDAFPAPSEATTYQDLKSALDTAKSALLAGEKTSLEKPVLVVEGKTLSDGKYNVTPTDTVTIKVNNTYPEDANLTYKIYEEGNSNPVHIGSSFTPISLSEGEHKYYVTISTTSENYKIPNATSETITVNVVGSVKVTVSADENGSAYISQYTDINGSVQTNTNESLTTVDVQKGTNVTFKAVPNPNYQVASWNGDISKTSETYTIETVNTTTTVKVAFKENLGEVSDDHFLLFASGDKSSSFYEGNPKEAILQYGRYLQEGVQVRKSSDNVYSVKLTDAKYFTSNNWFAFTTDSSTPQNSIVGENGKQTTVTNNSTGIISTVQAQDWSGRYAIQVIFKDKSLVQSLTISYKNNAYTVSATERVLPQDMVYLYAAKGSQNGNKFAENVKINDGITENYNIIDAKDGNYQKFSAKQGDKVIVQYTMESLHAQAGYYIGGLVVDGKKVEVTRSADGVYVSEPIALTKEKTEVTPVYYNSVIDANNDYITVYATAPTDITDLWGNTLGAYSWYKDASGKTLHGDGVYPGQPMMQEGDGKYVTKVAKYYYSYSNGAVTKTDYQILGVLFNSFAENQDSRKSIFLNSSQKANNQTYDYDDFLKIAAMGYDTVQFDIKYDKNKATSNQSAVVGDAINAPEKTGEKAPASVTDYEDLKNIDGKLVSILGYDNETIKTKQGDNATGLITENPLKIISVGNQKIYPDGDIKWSTSGSVTPNEWSTIWYVYDNQGNYITRGLPSDFIPRGKIVDGKFVEYTDSNKQTAAYNAIVNATGDLEYTSAVISYETRTNEGTNGQRVDGRWYYARSADRVDVEVGIIYKNSDNTYSLDKTDNDIKNLPFAGKITGASASISYTDSVGGEHSQIAKDSIERNTTVKFTADNSSTYEFIGWSTAPNPNPADIISKDANAISISTATKLYAVYEPYASGTLVLNHSKYNGSGANGGLGTYYIKAEVCDSNGNVVATFGGESKEGPIIIPETYISENSTYKIKVTLYTKPSANSTFVSFYGYEKNDFTKFIGSTTKTDSNGLFVSETYEIEPAKLFTNGTQTVMAVNYYTDLKLPVLESEIVFNYQPYKKAPNPAPTPGNGTGTTTFTLTITKDGESTPAFEITNPVSSLTLSASSNISSIISDYINSNDVDYTVTITLNPQAGSRSYLGKTYLQGTEGYEQKSDGSVTSITVTHKLSNLYDKTNRKFTSDTVNYYTDFTADEYTFNATFIYNGYNSREYFDENGYGTEFPADKTGYQKKFTITQTIYGADIDNYLKQDEKGAYKLTDQFLIDFAPYEDNFVQTITWNLENATVSFANSTVTATIKASYESEQCTVTVHDDASAPSGPYTVDYAELVTDALGNFRIKASDSYQINGETQYFNYWQIKNDHEQVVAKCYNTEFNYRVYDNYTVTAVYSTDKSASSRPNNERYTTIQFLEYSRNQFDKDGSTTDKTDKVYADFAIAYYYDRLQLRNDKSNLEVGVVFAFDKAQNSDNNSWTGTDVSKETVENYIKGINSENTNLKFINKKIDKTKLDNKNRVEFSWKIDNIPANQPLNLVAYSYIKKGDEVILSSPQEFKFYEVGNQTYKITTNNS